MGLLIGIIAGSEGPFPYALVDRINQKKIKGITAEYARIPDTRMGEPCPYRVMVDRVSHVMEFFRPYLKNAALSGTYVINNPFWWRSDDKFFNCCVAEKLGIAVPRTVLVPARSYPEDTPPQRFSSLAYPLDWEAMVDYIGGFPAVLKPYDGGGWRHVYIVNNWDELMEAYRHSGELVMILQEYIRFEHYVRVFVLGKKYVMPIKYDPFTRTYLVEHLHLSPELGERVNHEAQLLNQVLGYDMNTVEFAIRDGVPYAIDFKNFVPDSRPETITPFYYEWVVEHMAKVCIEYALSDALNIQHQQIIRARARAGMGGHLNGAVTEMKTPITRKGTGNKSGRKRS